MIENLVFEGGGVKGIAYGGALIRLNELGHMENIKRVAGTSAGAIAAVLLSVGYTPEELSGIIKDLDFNKFADDDIGIVRDLHRLVNKFGYYKGDYFLDWIDKRVYGKLNIKQATFKDLKEAGCPDLSLVATNLSKQQAMVFNFDTHPDLPICYAARMSMSIPFYFQAWRFQEDIMMDGGLSENYPINLFDDICEKRATLGFRLDTSEEIAINKGEEWLTPSINVEDLVDCAQAVFGYMMDTANKKHLKSADKDRTVFIDTLDVKTTEFDITDPRKEALIQSGREAVNRYFMR